MVVHRFTEKRDYPRISISAEFSYSIDGDHSLYSGLSRNLSHSGIQFVTEHELPLGKSIEFTLDSKDGRFQPLKARAEVLRVETIDNKFVIAGKIVEYK